jgi:hypothetical protein
MNNDGEVVFLISADVDRILRILYHGSRPPGVRYLICSCARVASLIDNDSDALGWQILPHPICPECRAKGTYNGPARQRYLADLAERLTNGKPTTFLTQKE